MEDSFKLEIISPEKIIFSNNTKMVTLPSYEGDMSVLKNHISIITFLRPGIIKIQKDDNNFEEFFVEEGTVEFSNNTLIILSSTITPLDSLTKEKISKMLEESKNELGKDNLNDKARYILSHKLDLLLRINQ